MALLCHLTGLLTSLPFVSVEWTRRNAINLIEGSAILEINLLGFLPAAMAVNLEGYGIAGHDRQLQLPAALQRQQDIPLALTGTEIEGGEGVQASAESYSHEHEPQPESMEMGGDKPSALFEYEMFLSPAGFEVLTTRLRSLANAKRFSVSSDSRAGHQ